MRKVEALPNKFCKYLRAKNPYGTLEGGENPWYLLDEALMTYWCLRSMNAVGPDESYVEPRKCTAGRSCFCPPSEGTSSE
jgi:hypothetical protein